MAHIICITGGLTGMLNASLALVDQLPQAGHQVTYASPANLRAPVTAQGISYVQLDPWVMQSGDPPMNRWQKWRRLKSRQQRAVNALGVQGFATTMQSHRLPHKLNSCLPDQNQDQDEAICQLRQDQRSRPPQLWTGIWMHGHYLFLRCCHGRRGCHGPPQNGL